MALPVTIIVDALHGTDRPGQRPDGDGYQVLPYQSLANAAQAARSGDTIRVMPGTYSHTGTTLARAGSNPVWYFEPGAVVNIGGAVRNGLYDDGVFGVGTWWHS